MASQSLHAGEPTEKEIAALKIQRDVADAYMRKATQLALKNLEKVKDSNSSKEMLSKHLERKRYFDTGTTKPDLVAFAAQVAEAEKAKIKLTDPALEELIKAAVLHQVDQPGLTKIEEEVRQQYPQATSAFIMNALAAEFRARIIRDLNVKKK